MTTLIHKSLFWLGYQLFRMTGKTPAYPYYSFRKLFVNTKGRSNDELTAKISEKTGRYEYPTISGVLGSLDDQKINQITSEISKNGYYIFEQKLDEASIGALTDLALTMDAELMPPAADGTRKAKYERNRPLAPKYHFDETELMSNGKILELATDFSLMAVAQAYLGTKPIQDLTAMWWSTAFSKKASSEAAQLYHFDMDRIKFIKFFFYLTDVDAETGPHCYIRGTNKWLPDSLWRDGRIADDDIERAIRKEDIVEITGSRGTVIAVDTRGLHKGKPLTRGERLILQFEFTNSLFGAPYSTIRIPAKIDNKHLETLKKYPYTFQRFTF